MLMEEAERIAKLEHGSNKMAVISGVGTRHYYRKLGYELEGPYMVKDLWRKLTMIGYSGFIKKSFNLFIRYAKN